jgi:hypothetical protein
MVSDIFCAIVSDSGTNKAWRCVSSINKSNKWETKAYSGTQIGKFDDIKKRNRF